MAGQRNAFRRLQRILNDEEYGPKLVRLNKSGQRRVLDKIERGDKDTRKLIRELDADRRARNTAAAHARKERQAAPEPEIETGPGGPDWRVPARVMGELAAERVPGRIYQEGKYVAEAKREGGLRDWNKFLALRGSPEAMLVEARYAAATNQGWSVFWYHYW